MKQRISAARRGAAAPRAAFAATAAVLALAATPALADDAAAVRAELNGSFSAKGVAGIERLVQDDVQAFCTKYARGNAPEAETKRLQDALLARVAYPADGRFLGDWKKGEQVAQSGVGLQYSDAPDKPNGGNCYACHQLTAAELSYGTIGPSLRNYGKLRGNSPDMLRYTWARLWNSQAYNICNQMPRFGERHILTDEQLRDVMALLMDPNSPVNQ